MINVLFVCLGNICRSPMAEGVFRHLVEEAGLSDSIHVDSAGTSGFHVGESAHPGTVKVLRKHDIIYSGRSRQFDEPDLTRFNYVLAMDRSNFVHILRVAGVKAEADTTLVTLENGTVIAQFLHFAHEAGQVREREVPDPYYDGRFDEVYELVTTGATALLTYIRKKENV